MNSIKLLQLFTEYGKLAMEGKSSTTKPFQVLSITVKYYNIIKLQVGGVSLRSPPAAPVLYNII